MQKYYTVSLVESRRKENVTIRSIEMTETEVERVGGVGNVTEIMSSLLSSNEKIEIEINWEESKG